MSDTREYILVTFDLRHVTATQSGEFAERCRQVLKEMGIESWGTEHRMSDYVRNGDDL